MKTNSFTVLNVFFLFNISTSEDEDIHNHGFTKECSQELIKGGGGGGEGRNELFSGIIRFVEGWGNALLSTF